MNTIRCGRCGKNAHFLQTIYKQDGSGWHIYRCRDCLWQGEVRK